MDKLEGKVGDDSDDDLSEAVSSRPPSAKKPRGAYARLDGPGRMKNPKAVVEKALRDVPEDDHTGAAFELLSQ